MADLLVVVTIGNVLQRTHQLVERLDSIGNGNATEEQNEQQADNEEGQEDIR